MRIDNLGEDAPSANGPSTDFESMSHREMLAMLEGVNPKQVTDVATHLTQAGTSLSDIAKELSDHMSKLDWQSTAGDAFREWGHKVASATHTLSDYASTAGDEMSRAGQVLHEVQGGMPAIPQGAVNTAATYRQHKGVYGPFGDAAEGTHAAPGAPTPTTAEYHAAVTEMSDARTSAVDNMTKLGSAYDLASQMMGRQDAPDFPPLPTVMLPPDPGSRDTNEYDYQAGSSVVERRVAPPVGELHSGEHEVTGGGVPKTDTRTGTIHVDDFGGGRSTGGTHVAEPPATLGTPHGPGRVAPVLMPPSETGPESRYPGGSSRSGGPGPAGDEDEFIGGMPGGGSPFGPGGRSASRTSMGEGIEGGTLVEPPAGGVGGSRPQFSSGTVIGERSAGLPTGTPTGRPTLEEPDERPGGPEFGEPGATGTGGPRMGGLPQSASRREERGRRGGNRPDYLVEDEETWMSGGTGVVPSVFE